MRITPNERVNRTREYISERSFLELMQRAQADYRANPGVAPAYLDEVNIFWRAAAAAAAAPLRVSPELMILDACLSSARGLMIAYSRADFAPRARGGGDHRMPSCCFSHRLIPQSTMLKYEFTRMGEGPMFSVDEPVLSVRR